MDNAIVSQDDLRKWLANPANTNKKQRKHWAADLARMEAVDNPILQAALDYARRGYFIFPCREKPGKPYTDKDTGELVIPQEKTPYYDKNTLVHGLHDATSDPAIISAWWKAWPKALIGCNMGKSGLVLCDIDTKHGKNGLATWQELGANDAEAWHAITPSGGKHRFFRDPTGGKIASGNDRLGDGVDVKARGGYGILPPSVVLEGEFTGPYVADNEWNHEPGQLPKALVIALARTEPKAPTPNGHKAATSLTDDTEKARQALNRLSSRRCDDYGSWIAVGMALQPLGSAGLALWDNWSRKSAKYVEGECAVKWETFEGEGLTLASLFHWAGEDDPAGNHPPEQHTPPEPALWTEDDPKPAQEETTEPTESGRLSTWEDIDGVLGPIAWAWEPWLPMGMLTILAGESGAGKSALALRLAACFLCGETWPDGKPYTGDLGYVLWAEAESAQAINLSRAKAWRLPTNCILTPLDDPLMDFKLDIPAHTGRLAEKAVIPEVRLIVVDSLRGANSKDENSSDTMGMVRWLAALARDTGKPVILTHHLRKRGIYDTGGVDLERLRGSSAIVQTARSVMALDVPDPENNRDWKRLQVIKSNLAKFPEPVGMYFNDNGIKFGLAPRAPKTETVTDRAADLLLSLLQDSPQPAKLIEQECNHAGISIATMKRAKAKMGIVSTKPIGKPEWYWSLPTHREMDHGN